MSAGEAVARLLSPESPWLFYVAGVLLLGAAGIGRRLFASQARQGARIGALEQKAEGERIRRLQLESVLEDEGSRLPYWPPDGARRPARELRDLDDEPVTRQAPAVPPFPPERHSSAAPRR